MLVGVETDRLETIEEVADRFHISKNHLMKVAYQLGQAEYLETVRGRKRRAALGKSAGPDRGGGRRPNVLSFVRALRLGHPRRHCEADAA